MLTTTCAVCGAEESVDALLYRALDDDTVRRLIADVITHALPVGAALLHYLRLHKPPKQRLRMSRVAVLLGEVVPDITREAITRKGRDWPAPPLLWKHALDAVLEARDAGTLRLPLEGNGYLYEVVLRLVDRAEAEREKARERGKRGRAHQAGPVGVGAVLLGQGVGQLPDEHGAAAAQRCEAPASLPPEKTHVPPSDEVLAKAQRLRSEILLAAPRAARARPGMPHSSSGDDLPEAAP